MQPLAVELQDITLRFGETLANDQVSLRVRRQEIHAIVGENGAGKSTLMRILYGMYRPDSGEIRVNGNPARFRSPHDAIQAGIGMVHQHFMLVQPFTVAENIVLGAEPALLSASSASASVAELVKNSRIDVNPDAVVSTLGVGQQQRVEILKVLYRQAEIIIFDEPTAVLTPQEVDEFFQIIRSLRDAGKTIILITHKLREVMALSDHVTVLRAGRNVAELVTGETTPDKIARLMVGRDVVLPVLAQELSFDEAVPTPETPEQPEPPALVAPVLEVYELGTRPKRGQQLHDISLLVRPGEILGIAGVEGNGQVELVEALTGLHYAEAGSIRLGSQDITHATPRVRAAAGLACIPEDRHGKGLILDFTLRENLLLGRHHSHSSWRSLANKPAAKLLRDFDVRPPNPRARAKQLSGGNQQKVIVAREVSRDPRVLIAAQPTRGVDLGAIEFIHRKLLELRAAGCAILLVSAELTEILALSDRIAVMFGGTIVYTTENKGITEQDLGVYMTGAGTPV